MRLGDLDALKESIKKRLGISSLKYLTEQEKVIVDEIDNAPTVEPTFGLFKEMLCSECGKRQQNEWIKTSEKNPKRSGFYITTCEDICCRNIRVCGYDAVQKKWSRGGVVAWMPKPEPYED